MLNTDCTIYNKFILANTEKYVRTHIDECAWENRKIISIIQSGLIDTDEVVVFIFFSDVQNYLDPKNWKKLLDKSTNWTLQPGDYVVRGNALDEINADFTVTDLKKKYDDVIKITRIDTKNQGSIDLHHWRIVGS